MLAECLGEGRTWGPERGEAADEACGVGALGRAHGVRRPFGAVHVVRADEGGLAAHGEAHLAFIECAVHPDASGEDLLPLLLGVRLGDARAFGDALDFHLEAELDA